MKRLIATLTLVIVPSIANALSTKDVDVEDMRLLFRGENFGLSLAKAQVGNNDNYTVGYDYQGWVAERRYATVMLIRRIDDRSWGGLWDIEQTLGSTFKSFQNKSLRWGNKGDRQGPLGTTRYQRFEMADFHCFAWQSVFVGPNAAREDSITYGAICDKDGMTAELEDAAVSATGYRGLYKPPLSKANATPKIAKAAAPQATAKQSMTSVPFAASWEGWQALLSGTLSFDGRSDTGPLKVSGDGVECRGTWKWNRGEYGTDELPTGTWSLACDNGKAASGTYTSENFGSGNGEGIDASGNTVKVRYGG